MEWLLNGGTQTLRDSPRKRKVDFHVCSHIAWSGPGVMLHHLLLINVISKLTMLSVNGAHWIDEPRFHRIKLYVYERQQTWNKTVP